MTEIDKYLAGVEKEKAIQLERLRKIALELVPNAEETISYGMPTLKYNGTGFFGFSVHTKHIGIYPFGGEEVEIFKGEFDTLGYKYSKGAIQVPFDKPIPEKLLKKIIKHRIGRIEKNNG